MSDEIKPTDIARILKELHSSEDMRHQAVARGGLDPQLVMLREWQAQRLSQTYADLLEHKHYRPACLFFLNDIYAAKDFSQRDHDAERLHKWLSRFLPAPMLQLLSDTIELNNLTNALDQELLRALVEQLGVTDHITPELYAAGYRICDNYVVREYQIRLIVKVVKQVAEGARLPLVGGTLRLARLPAHKMGWFELQDFLERAHSAFKNMKKPGGFVQAVQEREMRILDQIFAGLSDPFAV